MKKLSIILGLVTSFVLFAALYQPYQGAEIELSEKGKKEKFQNFLKNFDNIQLPYKIDQDAFQKAIEFRKEDYGGAIYKSNRRVTKEFKTFVPGVEARFSRSGPSVYLYEAVLANTNTNATVLYSIYHPYHQFPEYRLVTYSAIGEILEEIDFAARTYQNVKIGSIDKEKNVLIKTYSFNVEELEDYESKVPFANLKLKNVTTLKVAKNGKLEENATAGL